MKLSVDDLEEGVGIERDKTIQIRLSGEDIKFVATEYSMSFFIDEDCADRIAFQLQTILQDRYYRKNPDKIPVKTS